MSFPQYREDMREEFRSKAAELSRMLATEPSSYCNLVEAPAEPLCGLRCQIFEKGVLVRETGIEGVMRKISQLKGRRRTVTSEGVAPVTAAEDVEKLNVETARLIEKLKTQICILGRWVIFFCVFFCVPDHAQIHFTTRDHKYRSPRFSSDPPQLLHCLRESVPAGALGSALDGGACAGVRHGVAGCGAFGGAGGAGCARG